MVPCHRYIHEQMIAGRAQNGKACIQRSDAVYNHILASDVQNGPFPLAAVDEDECPAKGIFSEFTNRCGWLLASPLRELS
jgi:hypothetical protein